ncbi:MAG: YbaK/EbsC family protein [Vicinamibacterales bacterium]|jgi:Ala-tRNA(Pro) deacylase|nr:YbaK/EbsC family protein [Vicinamibacterales bacterium]
MSVPRVIEEFLNGRGVRYSTLTHTAAFTAQQETAAAHVPGREWAKTVVCFAGDESILAVLPAPCSIDESQLRRLAGTDSVRLAREGEFASLYPESELGAMPPLGPFYGQRVLVDVSLTHNPEIVFQAGTHTDAIRMQYRDFEQLVHPLVGEFTRRPS